jgi:hypothetical protein
VLGYERAAAAERLLMVANLGSGPARVRLPAGGSSELVIGTGSRASPRLERGMLILERDEGILLRLP